MDKNERDDLQISGQYQHFKGNLYDLYCVAYDRKGKKYVLYQQCYGDNSFWIRPYFMFFENVPGTKGVATPRFSATPSDREKAVDKVKKLIDILKRQSIIIRHTETEEEYLIISINENDGFVTVHSVDSSTGYLTDFELLRRMGYSVCLINGQVTWVENEIGEDKKLIIGSNDIGKLIKEKQINPCSIELQIADDGYLETKRCHVDPQSIKNVTSVGQLWKEVKVKLPKRGSRKYFKLRPGRTVLTHTREIIRVPLDCAAKIEIKSTFARLAIDITSGDFCNPGYYGYYPLQITNRGKHTIILRQGETMAQLMLIPLHGPIIEEYQSKATFKDKRGIDDGTPNPFWRERAITRLREEGGTQTLINLYNLSLGEFSSSNTSDVNETKKRFGEGFLSFCQKRVNKAEFKKNNIDQPDPKKLLQAYSNSEKRLRNLCACRWGTMLLALAPIPWSIIKFIYQNSQRQDMNQFITVLVSTPIWALLLAFVVLLGGTIALFVFTPKEFCTFAKIDIDKLCERAESYQEDPNSKNTIPTSYSA